MIDSCQSITHACKPTTRAQRTQRLTFLWSVVVLLAATCTSGGQAYAQTPPPPPLTVTSAGGLDFSISRDICSSSPPESKTYMLTNNSSTRLRFTFDPSGNLADSPALLDADPREGWLAANEMKTVTVTLSNSGKRASEGQHERRPWFDYVSSTFGYGVVEFTFALTMTDDGGTRCRPSVPTNVRVTALPGNMPECEPFPDDPKPGREWRSLRVEWDAPLNPGSSPITAYYVTDGGFPFGADTLTGTTIGCLLPDTEYFVGVRARNDHGYSPWSEPVSQWTRMPPSPPQTPSGGGSGSSGSSGGRSGSSSGGSGGSGSLEDLSGYLENPGADSFQSGIGVISGWVCEAETVEIEIETEQGEVQRQPAAYGTERVDTEEACGDTANGFGLLFNWNLLGDGEHEVVALVDGIELDRATVTVTTLGKEFVREGTGTCAVEDFPTRDKTVTLAWQQTQQNFVIVDGPAPAGTTNRAGTPGVGYLENPGPNSFQSGIGVISGWVCEGAEVIIELNGEPQPATYGTERLDTEEACGDTDNGFGLLFNWNLLGDGEHTVVAWVDGVELGRAAVRVTTLGKEFVKDVTGECVVEDFPAVGETVTLEWQENSQNFVITNAER